MVRGILLAHMKSMIVLRYLEVVAKGDDMGVDFDYLNARIWNIPITEFRQRSAAQPHDGNVSRRGHEQQESHHEARVSQNKIMGPPELHPALNVAA